MNRIPGSRAERVYQALLRLYPREFRRDFGDDMAEYFCDRLRAARAERTRLSVPLLWVRVAIDLVQTAVIERWQSAAASVIANILHTLHTPVSNRTGDSMLTTVGHDLRYAVRTLRRSPVFTVVALLVIALGTGAVTTIFSAANSLVFQPLPGTTKPSELVEIQRSDKNSSGSSSLSASYPYYVGLRDGTRSMQGIAAWTMTRLTISRGNEGVASLGNIVSGNYFEVMGARPALGRFFLPDEDRVPGLRPVVVVSHAFWSRHFGSDTTILGKTIQINSHPFTVVGITSAGFHGVYTPINTDVWVPLMMKDIVRPGNSQLLSPTAGWLELVGRVRPGLTHEAIQKELSSVTERYSLASEPPFFHQITGVRIFTLFGLPSDAKGPILGFTALLLGVAGLVLLIASANVAGMLLARATARRREMALRVALGAARTRIIRQLLTESLLLFVLGGVGGLVFAFAGSRALEHMPLPSEVPIVLDLTPDARVLTFTLVVSLVTGLMFGLAPAMAAARADVSSQLRRDLAETVSSRSRLRSMLVVGQLALSLVLLVSAGLFVRAFDKGLRVNPGFSSANVAVAAFEANTYGYDEGRSRLFYSQLKSRLAARPGVLAISYTRTLPLSGSTSGNDFRVDGYEAPDGNYQSTSFTNVDPDYFKALRIPLVSGRAFLESDGPSATRVAIVNEAFARRYWPARDAIGHTFHQDSTMFTVVGVVSNSKFANLNEKALPFLYFPISQSWNAAQNLMVHSTLAHKQVSDMVREEVRGFDATIPVPLVTTLDAVTSTTLLPQRIAASVTGAFGVLGLGLAAVGLYGIVAYTVSQRTREIGVRIALGATARNVITLVLRDGMRLVVVGLSIGLLLAVAATRLLNSFLFGVSATDVLTFVAVPILLAVVAAMASYLPARRAAGTDPLEALRAD